MTYARFTRMLTRYVEVTYARFTWWVWRAWSRVRRAIRRENEGGATWVSLATGPMEWERLPFTEESTDRDDYLQRWAGTPPPAGSAYRVVRDEWEFPEERTEHNPERLPERTVIEWEIVENGDFS